MKNLKKISRDKPMIIAGPCSAESKSQILASIKQVKKRHIDFMRICLWKPRTKPGFEGLKEAGLDLLIEAARAGINPGTEVLLPDQAEIVMDTVLRAVPDIRLLLWIGARNQNHYNQREIARVAARDKRVLLMLKNQPWVSEDHWEGIIGHALDGGIDKNQLIVCHRGFTPNGVNPHGFRNVPDYAMAMKIKNKTKLPMLFDPSHTGGSVNNVLKIAKESSKYDFDGMVIEVHTDPINALTDAKQQLTWEQFDTLLPILKFRNKASYI